MNVFWNLGKFNGVYDIFWMVPVMGFFPAVDLRWLRGLLSGTLPDTIAQYGHIILLQRGPLCRRTWPLHPR